MKDVDSAMQFLGGYADSVQKSAQGPVKSANCRHYGVPLFGKMLQPSIALVLSITGRRSLFFRTWHETETIHKPTWDWPGHD